MNRIYMDHAASTPVHPLVAEEMLGVMTGAYGNASSVHAFGREAKRIVAAARERAAAAIGARPGELVFTSGGTESDNAALLGAAAARIDRGRHLLVSRIEHHAVLHTAERLEEQGFEVEYIPVDEGGRVDVGWIREHTRPDTTLISVMYANNEVGTIQPVEEIAAFARERGVWFHTDAVQALGSLRVDCAAMGADLVSFSAHKINGPQGIGALYIAPQIKLPPLLLGGNQERGRRAGTENLAGIAGFARAAELAASGLEERREHALRLRAQLLDGLRAGIGGDQFVVNGDPDHTLAHIVNISFPSVGTETMLMNLDMEGIAAASGSACTSGSLETSHVLRAMNLSENVLNSAIRFSFGLGNTSEEIEFVVKKVETIIRRVRR
ncbi:cysteine desulfurase family protein [Saccharibacillus sp. CPCC 101409]|uniref:cysteine desulfurase family protein n=1 Tax=Saccharibacillus sp. CPCC 101409 TaxID=3058041 RepID=UPI002672E1B3|nr:cysteine desulfurase family protein [Saccharibacillus sp. CPCC 101409]MDO3409029.1 cysteine desulfurase family protein [Saccharibacillus sp. CPCC 101409]